MSYILEPHGSRLRSHDDSEVKNDNEIYVRGEFLKSQDEKIIGKTLQRPIL